MVMCDNILEKTLENCMCLKRDFHGFVDQKTEAPDRESVAQGEVSGTVGPGERDGFPLCQCGKGVRERHPVYTEI